MNKSIKIPTQEQNYLLYIFIVNDISHVISNIKIFADDTALNVIVNNDNDLDMPADMLNNDLISIITWAVAVNFTSKYSNHHHLFYLIINQQYNKKHTNI